MLDYEKLDVYECAIEHLAFVFRSIPASMSVPLNIAEAVGNPPEPELVAAKQLVVRVVGMLSKMCR